MKAGYEGELSTHRDALALIKAELEEFYAARHEDKDITGPLKDELDGLMARADSVSLAFVTGSKLVKAAVVPWQKNIFCWWCPEYF